MAAIVPRGPLACAAMILGAGLAVPGARAAQDTYPVRPIQIIVPYTPGTGADILSRILGPRMAERLNVPVVTENRSGATGNIGADIVAHAPPDGYTLLFTATSFGINPALSAHLPFDPVRSFAPVSLAATSAMALVVAAGVPARNLADFVALARREPGHLYYASPGNGGPQHLAMELVKLEAGIDLVHVPYRGSGGALSDLVAGQVQAMVVSLQTVAPYAQSGKVRMLAVLGSQRSAAYPDVESTAEAGYPGLRIETWYGLFAPAGTPAPILARLNAEVDAALARADVRQLLGHQGMQSVGGPPARLAQLLAAELSRWARVVNDAHVVAD
jgi:tripartite-type tricarboxylate transporter receptor subunit TctC